MAEMKSRKRPRSEDDCDSCGAMPLDEFNQDLLEKILSCLPASSFFRLRSVCKRWKSIASSPTFHNSCSEISFREPWFLMVDPDLNHSVVFDTSEGNWKDITRPGNPDLKPIPVAASGGLVCFLAASGGFTICNPLTAHQPHFHNSMAEIEEQLGAMKSRKRPRSEDDCDSCGAMPLDEFNQDLLEKILSCLPASSFFRLRSVCKRWKSIASSPTFHNSCSEISFREPWFLMVDPDLNQSVVFDTSEGNWKDITRPGNPDLKPIPVAASGGLVCFLAASGGFTICNPLTGARRQLPPAGVDTNGMNGRTHAIAMSSWPYKLVVVSGDFPNLSVKTYDSARERWEEEAALCWKPTGPAAEWGMPADHDTVYFLSKAGDVVATNMQRSPSKQYSSVLTVEEGGEEHLYFLSPTGAVVACNLAQRSFVEYPRLLPVDFEHSIDVVSCRGEMMVVILSEFLESASLRVWRFCRQGQRWHQVAAMPPSMSHEFYGKKADINCVGFRDMIFMCVSSGELSRYVTYSLVSGQWSELPRCSVKGDTREFMSAFAFEPRVEARV